ncbi:MAG: hypothetical protein QOE61_6706, partial [Micromonosporaceae bacterium]|nr:hypothetical protein [Micromonosporaceae bacterium]
NDTRTASAWSTGLDGMPIMTGGLDRTGLSPRQG